MVENNNLEFNSDKFEHVHYKAKYSEEHIAKYNSNYGTRIETNPVSTTLESPCAAIQATRITSVKGSQFCS